MKRVVRQGIGQCEDINRSEVQKVSTQEPKSNSPPIPRNQVDLINATVGQLLVFKVPEVRLPYVSSKCTSHNENIEAYTMRVIILGHLLRR